MEQPFTGKVAVVTGGNSGIGRARGRRSWWRRAANPVYAAVKFGVVGLTRSAAMQYGDGASFMQGAAIPIDGGQLA